MLIYTVIIIINKLLKVGDRNLIISAFATFSETLQVLIHIVWQFKIHQVRLFHIIYQKKIGVGFKICIT